MEQHAAALPGDSVEQRGRVARNRAWRRTLRGIARLATAICGVWLLVALLHSASTEATVASFRSAAIARKCLMLALIFWAATSDLVLKASRVEWR